MSTDTTSGDDGGTSWDLDYAPRRMRIVAVVLAVVILAVHIVWAVTLRNSDTGVSLGGGDQAAFVIIGMIFAGVTLSALRVRVRAGSRGVEVSGPLRSRVWEWEQVVGFTFPRGGQFPRLELPAYEYVSIWAIQAVDGVAAADAMDRLREVAGRYKPSAADPDSVIDR